MSESEIDTSWLHKRMERDKKGHTHNKIKGEFCNALVTVCVISELDA